MEVHVAWTAKRKSPNTFEEFVCLIFDVGLSLKHQNNSKSKKLSMGCGCVLMRCYTLVSPFKHGAF